MIRSAVIRFAFIVAAVGHVQAHSSTTTSADGVAVLRAYEGTWRLSSTSLDTAYSKAGEEEKEIRNECWQSANYFACDQFIDGVSQVMIVYTYDSARRIYTTYLVPLDGSAASNGTMHLDGSTWTFPWQVTQDGKTIYFRVVNVFESPTSILYRREFSLDQQHWVTMASGKEIKTQ